MTRTPYVKPAEPVSRLIFMDTRLLESSPFFLRTIDLAPTHVPERPGLYKRISYDKLGLAEGVARQDEDCELLRERMGWGPFVRRYDENDTSAYRKRKVRLADGKVAFRVIRPAFRQMLDDLEVGLIDGIVFYDMDRLARQPRDLEDLIDWVEYKKVPVKPVTGDIDLMTSGGRMLARMLVSVALKSSEDTSRRQARAAVQHAQQGRVVRGGPRRFGWEIDGQTLVPAEAVLLREVATRVEAGESLTTVALDFQRREIPTVGGKKWTRTALNNILRNPRLGGIRAYTGVFHESQPKVNEWWLRAVRYDGEWVRGDWSPILTADEWILLQNTLDAGTGRGAKSVKTPAATGRKHLLSGLCICGKCETRMVGRMVRELPSERPRRLQRRLAQCRQGRPPGHRARHRLPQAGERPPGAFQPERVVKAGDLERLQARKAGLRTAFSSGQLSDDDFYATLAELERADLQRLGPQVPRMRTSDSSPLGARRRSPNSNRRWCRTSASA